MITFKISFLISFPINKIETKKKRSKNEGRLNTLVSFMNEVNCDFDANNILYAVHINYEIIPNRIKYGLEIICWGPLAKITSGDSTLLLFTVVKEDRVWVPVQIEHYIESMTINEIKNFHFRIIDFMIINHIDEAAGQLKSESFTVPRSVVMADNGESFKVTSSFKHMPALSETEDNESDKHSSEQVKSLIARSANFSKGESVSWLNTSHDYEMFYETIEKIYSGQRIKINEMAYSCSKKPQVTKLVEEEQRDLKEKSSKMKRNKNKRVDKQNFFVQSIPAEIFFTSCMGTYHLAVEQNFIKDLFIFVSAKNLLTRDQKLELKPLVVKIFKIDNFPSKDLKERGYENVYACYKIPGVISCETVEKPIEDTIYFNESHMHFMYNVSEIKLLEALQMKRFYVDIFTKSIVDRNDKKPGLFGQHPEDFKFSLRKIPFKHFVQPVADEEETVLLAVSVFDISSLAENIWDFREIAQCHTPDHIISMKEEYTQKLCSDRGNLNEIHLNYVKRRKNIIPEGTLLELGTTLSVEVYLMAPQAPFRVYHGASNVYKRIFFIIFDMEFAVDVYNNILAHNKPLLENLVKKNVDVDMYEILTGFILDNGNNCFFYVEGLSTGFILSLWLILQDMHLGDEDIRFPQSTHYKKGMVFFNGNNVFQSRLYDQFLTIGMYVINLRIPFQDILTIPKLYCKNKVPRPCLQALTKLYLLFRSKSYKIILQQNLLPLPHELISLNVEWGVPNRWKELILVREDRD